MTLSNSSSDVEPVAAAEPLANMPSADGQRANHVPAPRELFLYQIQRVIEWVDGINPLAALLFVMAVAISSAIAFTSRSDQAVPTLFGTQGVRIKQTPYNARWQHAVQPVTHPKAAEIITFARSLPTEVQRLAYVQKAVFEAISYKEDRHLYGVEDYWATPNETLQRMAGDCEGVAILKLALLQRLGISPNNMFLTVGYDLALRSGHAVLAVRSGAHFYVLDQTTAMLTQDTRLVDFRPVVTLTAGYNWIHAERRNPILATNEGEDDA